MSIFHFSLVIIANYVAFKSISRREQIVSQSWIWVQDKRCPKNGVSFLFTKISCDPFMICINVSDYSWKPFWGTKLSAGVSCSYIIASIWIPLIATKFLVLLTDSSFHAIANFPIVSLPLVMISILGRCSKLGSIVSKVCSVNSFIYELKYINHSILNRGWQFNWVYVSLIFKKRKTPFSLISIRKQTAVYGKLGFSNFQSLEHM